MKIKVNLAIMKTLAHKRILLGITGGISAYKSADLVRRMKERGAEVRVVMTQAACEFVTPLTFQALSGRTVHTELLNHDSESGMGHIDLVRWCDILVVAPATANFIAQVTHGMANDLLTALCLAADVPVMIAPAMNQQMWANPATQNNIKTIGGRGISVVGPAEGDQACGETGPGRMLEPADILIAIESSFRTTRLTGAKVLVTAGPTREPIDPVRYISNHSSGRMGYEVARAAMEAGAEVTLISGPASIETPDRVKLVAVNTAEEMRLVVLEALSGTDIFISAAAVADYRCSNTADHKIKKDSDIVSLELKKNPDILAEVADSKNKLFTVGFAAETQHVRENALAKLADKGIDMIAANLVGNGIAFNAEENALEVLWKNGDITLEQSPKHKLARKLIQIIADQYHEKNTNKIH